MVSHVHAVRCLSMFTISRATDEMQRRAERQNAKLRHLSLSREMPYLHFVCFWGAI